MKNILVPTDFSTVSKNAAEYAVRFAIKYNIEKVVLYNAYQAPVIAEPTIPAMQIIDFDTLKSISISGLQQLKKELMPLAGEAILLEYITEFGGLDVGINDICKQVNAGMIVMGISGGNDFEERLIGSTATSVAHHTTTPLIIVPPQAKFETVEKIILACDFKKVEQSTPFHEIEDLLNLTGATLSILHIDENKKPPEDVLKQQLILQDGLKAFDPEFFFLQNEDFVEGINEFTKAHKVDLIVTIPKKHGLFDRLFKRSHTKHLAFHTTIPLVCIHEEGL